MLFCLWSNALIIGNKEIKANSIYFILPGLLLFILAFFAEISILGLLLLFYAVILSFTAGVKGVIPATFLMIFASIISINRFGVDSFFNASIHIIFGIVLSFGIGIIRDKYLKYFRKYRLTQFGIDNSNIMTFLFDEKSEIIYANQYALSLLEYEQSELIGKRFDWISSDEIKNLYIGCSNGEKYNSPFTFRDSLLKKDGKNIPVEINCKYLAYDGKDYGFLFAQDITEILKREKDIDNLLYRDRLTGLYNRRFFEEELKRLDTGRQLPLAILMVDVNGLKVINDTYGHKAGDRHLQKVAEILKKSIRQEDIVARWAGDEFVILMPNTDYKTARRLYQRIKNNCLISYQDGEPVSVAVGIAVKSKSWLDINDVLEDADKDMYKDKALDGASSGEHLIKHMLNELGEKSFETKEHVKNVRNLSLKLAERLGFSDEEKASLDFLAMFHDVGMAMLPDELISKKGLLDKDDWEQLRKHPEYGSKIINSLRDFHEVAENILSHHEWWNGQGYPVGLKGEDIPLYSRIIAIADAYDVMITGRPYKATRSKEDAINELKNYRGIQFDSNLVNEFVMMLEEDFNFEKNIDNELEDAVINTGVEFEYGDDGRAKEDN